MPLIDGYRRPISYLRVSITDRCNLRCAYCMPAEGVPPIAHADILRYEEIVRLVGIAVRLGIADVRLTGGEPLVRRGVVDLVRMLRDLPGLRGLTMTTNGTRLAPLADSLRAAGLQRVNISLDTLRADRYRALTRLGELADVLDGIEAAQRAGLQPVKINMVLMRGVNDDEIVDMARRSITHGWHVRFIEAMPLGCEAGVAGDHLFSAHEARSLVEASLGALVRAEGLPGSGPARNWRVAGAAGTIGFISAVSDHFCSSCNRLRLTADGRLFPCLFSDAEFDLRGPLREGATDAAIEDVFHQAIRAKGRGHAIAEGATTSHVMSRTGG